MCLAVLLVASGCASTTEIADELPRTKSAVVDGKVPIADASDAATGEVVEPGPVPTAVPPATSTERFEASQESTLWYPLDRLGDPYSEAVNGILTFRGSPNRSYLGKGPLPTQPAPQWRYPARPLCSISVDASGPQQWCGTGWTGQPAVWERDGEVWMAFGALDGAVHLLDAITGEPRTEAFQTGDLIKGSLTVDPDGHPLLYVGSRDNLLRVLSWDTGELAELWALDSHEVEPRVWNDDWDGSPVVLDDHLIVGGENSNLHAIRLNRSYDANGMVAVAPELVAVVPGWDAELRQAVGDNVSIEGSVTVVDNIAWFANSGGLVQGWDLAPLRDGGEPERVFRYWVGDDVDATVVVDNEGFIYVASEFERNTARSRELGQVIKLDPRQPDSPVVWSRDARGARGTGVWATPALTVELLIVPTATGEVLGIDRDDGSLRWELDLPGPLWSSPLIVDDVLIQGDCAGDLHAYDLTQEDPDANGAPAKLWVVDLEGCIESTPTLWEGRLWVGTRAGFMHLIAD